MTHVYHYINRAIAPISTVSRGLNLNFVVKPTVEKQGNFDFNAGSCLAVSLLPFIHRTGLSVPSVFAGHVASQ